MDEVGDGFHDAFFIENRRPDPGNQAASLKMPLLEHGYARIESIRRLFGLRVLQMIVGLELHDRPGQLLSQPIVDFVGDKLPFVVAGSEHVPEVAVFPRQCFLGMLSIRNVFDQFNEPLNMSIGTEDRVGSDSGDVDTAVVAYANILHFRRLASVHGLNSRAVLANRILLAEYAETLFDRCTPLRAFQSTQHWPC